MVDGPRSVALNMRVLAVRSLAHSSNVLSRVILRSTRSTATSWAGDGLEILFGIHAIARYLGVTRRQAHVLVRSRLIPTFDLAGAICARKPELRACINALPRSAGARGTPGC